MKSASYILRISGKKNQVFKTLALLCRWKNGQITLGELQGPAVEKKG